MLPPSDGYGLLLTDDGEKDEGGGAGGGVQVEVVELDQVEHTIN